MSKVYGIDLGTTYSCIAVVNDQGQPEVLMNSEGQMTTPSVVYFESEDHIVVGDAAQDESAVFPDQVFAVFKRMMGKPGSIFHAFGHDYSPQEISSHVLLKLVEDAEQSTGEKVEDVVITCPAYFDINQKEATKQAGTIAGLNVLYVIPEPTAAAITYGVKTDQEERILVYDLGGGTFDITLIEVGAEAITVLSTSGDSELGGKDWDTTLAQDLAERFSDETGTPSDELMENKETWAELLKEAERVKRSLSSKQVVKAKVLHEGDSQRFEVTHERFDELTSSFLERTLSATKAMLERAAELGKGEVHRILLVGGSTYMHKVKAAVEARFAIPVQHHEPNLAVAKGAALYGHQAWVDGALIKIIDNEIMGGKDPRVKTDVNAQKDIIRQAKQILGERTGHKLTSGRKVITNVTSRSFGVVVFDEATKGDVVSNLVNKDDQVPMTRTKRFSTHEDDQDRVLLRIMQHTVIDNEDRGVPLDKCTELGEAELTFERPLPKDSEVEITFKLSADGLLDVHGRDLTTQREVEAQFKAEGVLSDVKMQEAKSRALAVKRS
jgi:molecular chaperone DnaK